RDGVERHLERDEQLLRRPIAPPGIDTDASYGVLQFRPRGQIRRANLALQRGAQHGDSFRAEPRHGPRRTDTLVSGSNRFHRLTTPQQMDQSQFVDSWFRSPSYAYLAISATPYLAW